MKLRLTERLRKSYEGAPPQVQKAFDKQARLLAQNLHHPSLRAKKYDDLAEAISRYYSLLQMTFASNLYKIYETVDSQIVKFLMPQVLPPQQQLQPANKAFFEVQCHNCKTVSKLQANLGSPQPMQPGCVPFRQDNKFRCPNCGVEHDLSDTRRQLEAQTKKPLV